MKIRTGFVSNSSSSSFVMIGAKIENFKPDKDKMIEMMDEYEIKYDPKWPEDDFWDALYNEQFDGLRYLGEESIVGYMIATNSDYCMDYTETSAADIAIKSREVRKIIKKVFDEDVDVKLITGQYAC
ncbi:MAG: hypothetical protein ACXAC5_05265 [Promethearchaeota archaeon]|jgi:hypothetical protein